MIDAIIQFSVKNKLIVGVFTLLLIAFGFYNYLNLSIDAVPDITNNQVQVVTIVPSLAPQEVEQFITFPVEIAMSNIQDVTEVRSISRFGLSVVTIVFKDKMDIYLARQLVGEQIAVAKDEIPAGYGSPEMMPVTTGLGEIYQYVIEPQKGYENAYSLAEIRSVQDWIIKRQMSGIPGIVEISSFGGLVKEYEVSIDPLKLVALDVTLSQVQGALALNNQNTGGSYIEKGPEAFYIRAEGLVNKIEDIENIVVSHRAGMPVYMKDIGMVTIGWPSRYGAMTKDGKGEVVGGITLMLKGGNASTIIAAVKTRLDRVQSSLPEGLVIKPYLDRSRLIKKTSNTVSRNLLEGGVIVIFILILIMGSLRSGVIVASVIPLSMLFAFIMMNIFGVSANLMSLGAIDFGLIVDGAVIVVEGIMYLLTDQYNNRLLSQAEMDQSVVKASKRVGRSATFGVFIILIVYIPILAFQGIEGKTFRPMAQTVSFALLGALILSLTYVPMISSLFLKKKIAHKPNISDKIVSLFHRSHAPVLLWALRHKVRLVGAILILVVAAGISFSFLGGEFLPTLEEGDLALQMTIAPGSSLSQSIETSTKIERLLLENYPEVLTVVSKIGTAEVPTDPMAMEDADVMIVLKEKDEWESAASREELVEKMKETLSVLPGVAIEFTQPIQLRFNELMTGSKSDVAIKIYGDELDELNVKGREALALIEGIEGVGDVRLEQTTGLPQIVIRYRRDQLAQFGLNVSEINDVINTAFAGKKAGVIFEGEKRFDLVVRLEEKYRSNIQALHNLRINKPGGGLILLNQVADIVIEEGPMQISRENTQRNITVGVNVRKRDVESLVAEIDETLSGNLKLQPGYYVTYGGQFENLQTAKTTSSIAVPVSLILIFIMLYFAFNSLKQATMIFTAIPMAIIGGVVALFVRGMPFSISAGVGFIVLFGIVVLNGIVLIAYYNQLEEEGMTDIIQRVMHGTKMRLRPVILTASTDVLGFLPMAISNSPGAEVQKPLATVVIGGLITATFLTLVVLPAIYVLFNEKFNFKKIQTRKTTLILALLCFGGSMHAQSRNVLTLKDAEQKALEYNKDVRIAGLKIQKSEVAKRAGWRMSPLDFDIQLGEINSSISDYNAGIVQELPFPTKVMAEKKVLWKEAELEGLKGQRTQNEILYTLRLTYNKCLFEYERSTLYSRYDSLLSGLFEKYKRGFDAGQFTLMDVEMIKAESMIIRNLKAQHTMSFEALKSQLFFLTGLDPKSDMNLDKLVLYDVDHITRDYVAVGLAEKQKELADLRLKKERQDYFPDIRLGYFQQSIDGINGFRGWMAGLSVPFWFKAERADVKALKIEQDIAELSLQNVVQASDLRYENLIKKYEMLKVQIQDIRSFDDAISKLKGHAKRSLELGEIGFAEFVRVQKQAIDLETTKLELQSTYNMVVFELMYYTTNTSYYVK